MAESESDMPNSDDENIVLETPTQDPAGPLLQSGLQASSDEDITGHQPKTKELENNGTTRSSMDIQEGSSNPRRHKRQIGTESEQESDSLIQPTATPANANTIKALRLSAKRTQYKSFPTNATDKSSGNNNTVIIKQLSPDTRKISLDPISVARELQKVIHDSSIHDVRINKRRNIVAVEFKTSEKQEEEKLLSITKLGNWQVKCYRPTLDLINSCSGVIGPVGLDVNLEELLDLQKQPCKIVKITRLPKFSGSLKEESMVLKVDFEGKQLPEKVLFGFIAYKVRVYNPPPLRCYRCQKPRHLSSGCTAPVRCLLCAGNHSKEVCTSTTYKCANCGGPHIASHRECRYNIQAKAIDSLTRDGMSYDAARRQTDLMFRSPLSKDYTNENQSSQSTRNLSQQPGAPKEHSFQTTTIQADVHRSQGTHYSSLPSPPATSTEENTYSQVAQSSRRHNLNTSPTCVTSEQPPSVDAMEMLKSFIKNEIQKLSISICKFLKEIILTDLTKENKKEKELLTISATRKHLGSGVAEALLEEFHSRNTNAVSASVDCLIEACTPTQPGNPDLTTDNHNKKETNPKLKSYKNAPCPEKEESQLTKKQQNKSTRSSKKKKI